MGELAREINHRFGQKTKKPEEPEGDLGMEMADILFVLICMANREGIDLQEAFDQDDEESGDTGCGAVDQESVSGKAESERGRTAVTATTRLPCARFFLPAHAFASTPTPPARSPAPPAAPGSSPAGRPGPRRPRPRPGPAARLADVPAIAVAALADEGPHLGKAAGQLPGSIPQSPTSLNPGVSTRKPPASSGNITAETVVFLPRRILALISPVRSLSPAGRH